MMQPIVGRLVPTKNKEAVEYTYEATPSTLFIRTNEGEIRITFANRTTILIEGRGHGIGLRLDDIDKGGVFDFIHEIPMDDQLYYELNLYKNQDKFICGTQSGQITMNQIWNEKTASNCSVDVRTASTYKFT